MKAQFIDHDDPIRWEGFGTYFCEECGKIYYHRWRAERCCNEKAYDNAKAFAKKLGSIIYDPKGRK
jgi:hypothetical protein